MPLYTIETHGQMQPWLDREWLLTNGLGGFAASTVVGCNARRYHGLLCAATLPPVGRVMLLSRMAEILILDSQPDKMLETSVNQFGNNFHPHGEQYLRTFELDDVARWTFDVEGVKVVKEIQLSWMRNAVGLRYTIEPPEGVSLEFRLLPFLALRDFHSLRRGMTSFHIAAPPGKASDAGGADSGGGATVVVTGDDHVIHMSSDVARFHEKPDWWFGHTYHFELERGMDHVEDLFNPGWFTLRVAGKTAVTLWAGLVETDKLDWDAERANRTKMVAAARTEPLNVSPPHANLDTPVRRRLAHAANDFVVYRKAPDGQDGTSVVAGYPWFADWGRDTMISLPGLFFVTGRYAQAKQVLSVFAQYVSEGMIPNRFDDYTGRPEYNTVDASLWFIHAAFEYSRLSGDAQTFEKVLKPACRQIIDGYRRGTRYHIKMDEADGLISQGDADTQLTWMDAKCNGVAFTPRQGKPVEINALWYHGLKLMGEEKLAQKAAESFRRAFWISPFRGLADTVDGPVPTDPKAPYPQRDTKIRPNQIFAVSLANSPLNEDQQSAVVEVVRRELLTPAGLRSLARNDPGYRPRYSGNVWDRDSSYHNGTVWAWLIGGFLEAYLRVNKRSPHAVEQARRWLSPLIESMHAGCVGQIAEIYDADPPFRAVGCFAQAWSVAEALRLAVELEM